MLSAVKSEVTKEEHEDLGCHVLVIMSHGGLNNHIYGTDLKRVKLTDVYDLLTLLDFPGMAGKPKVVILEVCSGGNCLLQENEYYSCLHSLFLDDIIQIFIQYIM